MYYEIGMHFQVLDAGAVAKKCRKNDDASNTSTEPADDHPAPLYVLPSAAPSAIKR